MTINSRSVFACLLLAIVGCKSKDQTTAGAVALPSASAAPGVVAATTGANLSLLDGFEGEIGLNATGKLGAKDGAHAPLSFALLVKDGKFRFDLPEGLAGARELGKAYVLVMPAEKKLYAVMDAKKQAVLVELDKLAAQANSFGAAHGAASSTPAPQVTKTGKTDTVAGYPCEIWRITSAKSGGDLCIAEQGTSWFHLPLSGMPAEYAWASEIADGKHFPLRFIGSENGTEQGRIEVTRIQKRALPSEQFAVPAGYAIMNLEQMLAAMLGGMPGMPSVSGIAASGSPAGGITLPPGVKPPAGFKLPAPGKRPVVPEQK